MKILLIRNANTDGFGGAEELVLNLCSELEARDNEVILATGLPLLFNKAKKHDITVIRSPWLNNQSWHGWKQFLFPIYLIWLARLTLWYLNIIRRYQLEVLHPSNRDDWIAASLAGKLSRVKVVWSDHADLKHEVVNTNKLFKNWQGKLVLWTSRYASRITVVSQADLNEIRQHIGKRLDHKLTVVHNGVFDTNPIPVVKDKTSFVFGVTARLLAQKGLFELINAYKKIHNRHPQTQLWLVGDGEDRQNLEKLADGDSSICFVGYVENPLDYAASFDVFTFPTYTEGLSLSLLEAAMLGLPIITSNVGGNPEIITHQKNGLLIPSNDVGSLEAAMELLFSNAELRKKYGAASRKRFLDEFELSSLVERIYLPLYNSS